MVNYKKWQLFYQSIFFNFMSRSGLKICFVGIGAKQLSISILSAIAKNNGYKTSLAYNASLFDDRWNLQSKILGSFFDEGKEVLAKIKLENPDVLAFSPLTSTYQWSLSIAKKAKKDNPDLKIIFGGVHVSAVPDLVIEENFIDFVVVGEGEVALIKILENLEQDKENSIEIPNTIYRGENGQLVRGPLISFCKDLDSLPFYDQEIWKDYFNLNELYTTTVSRGCPNKCTYCFNSFFSKIPENNKGYLRFRSVEDVIEELLKVKENYNISYIDFVDDAFTADKNWLKKFLQAYRENIDLPFQCLTDSKYIDKDIGNWLKKSRCEWVQVGVQSVDADYKKNELKRYETVDQITSAIKVLKENNIKIKLDHMLGLPDEPIEAQRDAFKVYKKNTPERIQTFWTTYLPGTEMLAKEYEKGRISDQKLRRIKLGKEVASHRKIINQLDNNKLKIYKRYELIFKILPSLPYLIKKRIKPNTVENLPIEILTPFIFLIDILTGLINKNPDFIQYLKHYKYQISRVLKNKINFRG